MTEENKHWTNQVEVFCDFTLAKLKELLNEFFKDRFVIATQIFPREVGIHQLFSAVVYFKVPPESKQC